MHSVGEGSKATNMPPTHTLSPFPYVSPQADGHFPADLFTAVSLDKEEKWDEAQDKGGTRRINNDNEVLFVFGEKSIQILLST